MAVGIVYYSTLIGNGVQLLPSAAPAPSGAYMNYDGTNLVGNVPPGKGFAFSVNGTPEFSVSNVGLGTFVGAVGATQFNSTGNTGLMVNGGPAFGRNTGDGGANVNAPTGTPIHLQVNGTDVAVVSSTGSLKPTSTASGAASLVNVLRGTYVIDFPAFTAGVDQTSAQTLTGVAFGDCLSVGVSVDQSASIGQLTAMVTSAGNIKITASPVSTVSTADPASATYTVTAIRSA